MNTSARIRIERLSPLLLLALLVLALAVPAAQAMRFSGTTVPSTPAVSGTVDALQQPKLDQLRQYYDVMRSESAGSGMLTSAQRPTQAQFQRAHGDHSGPSVVSTGGTVDTGPSASSGISSTTVWMAAVAVVGALLISFWALARRRRQRNALPICTVEPAGC